MKLAVIALLLALSPVAFAQTAPPSHPEPMASGTDHEKPPVPPSKFLNLSFQGKTLTLKVEDLLALPQVTVHVHNAHRDRDESYSGPLLSDVLAKIGLVASKETEPLILHSAVVATGTDHYFVLYSAAECEPMFAHGQVIVAVMKAGLPNTEGGMLQLVNTTDVKPARWLHGLTDLNIVSIAPQH
jgi:hypothetical protein